MVVVAVKKFITKKGKRYGPYPKDPNTYYLYEVHRNAETGKVKQKFIGKGPKTQPSDVDKEESKGFFYPFEGCLCATCPNHEKCYG